MKRLESEQRSRSFPLVLLLLAFSTVFLFGNDRDRFYRPGHHDWVSSEHLAVAVNLSPAHNFLMFHRLSGVEEGGGFHYQPYNRFPVGGYALISLATLPFRDDLSAQLYAARMLMLAFFVAAAVAAYHATSRLSSSRWIALTAVLLSFSSYYHLYYNDMVHPKTMMDLFGVLLTFHGMVVFLQEGRFRQLLVKACTALLLGWHVLALVLAFVALGMMSEIVRMRSTVRKKRAVESPAALLLRGRSRHYLTLGVVALLLAASILTFNFVNEYTAHDGRVAWTHMASVRSMLSRTGLDEKYNEQHAHRAAWSSFLEKQIRRIGRLSVPFALFSSADPTESSLFTLGIVMTVACLVCLVFVRRGLPFTTLVSSGFLWALPMRYNTAFHDYECLFYIGIPLVVFTTGTSFISRLSRRSLAGLSCAAVLVFVLSSAEMSRVGHDAEAADIQEALIADFDVIHRMTEGKTVYVPVSYNRKAVIPFAGARHALHYYLAGSVIRYNNPRQRRKPCRPGFVVTRERVEGATLLTPGNRLMFLYDRAEYDKAGQSPRLCAPDGGFDHK